MLQYLSVQWQERNLGRTQWHDRAYINYGPVGDPDANLWLYDSLKERNQRPSHLRLAPTFTTTRSGGRGHIDRHCTSQRASYGRSNIGQQSSNQHADWCDQYSHCLLSLLTCLRPTSLLPRFRNRQPLYHHLLCMLPSLPLSFLPAFLVLKRLRCQHRSRFSLPHPRIARRSHWAFIWRVRTPCAHSRCFICPFPSSGDATAEGSPGVAFDSTTLFYWITLTSLPLPPHAEPPLVIDHEGEAVPDRSEQSESFELVSPPSISALNGDGGNDHIDANAWWTDFTGPDPRLSASQRAPLNSSKVKGKSKSNFSWSISVTRLLHKCKPSPWTGICKSIAIRGEVAEEIQDPSWRRSTRIHIMRQSF